LWSAREVETVGAGIAEWAAERGISVAEAGGRPDGFPAGPIVAIVGFESDAFPPAGSGQVGQVVILDASRSSPGPGALTVGEPGGRRDQAGFAAGLLAGYVNRSGWVGLIHTEPGEAAAAYGHGYNLGLRYACPRCRLMEWQAAEVTADLLRANAVDVLLVLPGGEVDRGWDVARQAESWIVWLEDAPADPAGSRAAGGVSFDILGPLRAALQALLDGEDQTSWPYSVENGGVTIHDVDPRALSPGRRRLLEEALTQIASGELSIDAGALP
jgi:hypothetical protein